MPANCKIVLVRPRNPNNIGAVARAMKNFGFLELAVVVPFAPTWNEAVSAVNAEEVLTQARVFDTLAEAVADCTLVIGTADRTRVQGKQRLFTPDDLHRQLVHTSHRLALVFGSEKHGLTKDDLSHCHHTLSLPTTPDCPSMNLGQAVAICCYELARTKPADTAAPRPTATAGEIEAGLQLLAVVLREVNFVSPLTAAATITKLRQRLLHLDLTSTDVHLLCGVLRQIQWSLGNK